MSTPDTVRLAIDPGSAAEARRFVRERASLDSMRHTEADLLVTELVGNMVRHATHADSFSLQVDEADVAALRVTVSHRHPRPLEEPQAGLGFTLLDRVARDWGYEHNDGTLSVWFRLRTPGSASSLTGLGEAELFDRMEQDPAACSDELVRRHRDLAISIARGYRGKGVPAEDLDQVALMGLLKAIQRYDAEMGDIRPYAAATISGEMKKLLRDRAWSVRVPRPIQERALEVTRATEELAQELNRPAGIEEIANHLDLTVEDVSEALGARLAYSARSMENPSEQSGVALAEQLEERSPGMVEVDDRVMLEEAISQLSERQRRILDLRYNHDMTQSEIASVFGISQMHVSRLLSEAIETLRGQVAGDESF